MSDLQPKKNLTTWRDEVARFILHPHVRVTGLTHVEMGMDQYLLIPFLVGWTSIYQLFWGSLGTGVLTHPHIRIQCFTKVCKNAVEVFPPRHVEWCPHIHSLRHIFLSTFHICNIFLSTFASGASPSRCMYVFISAASSKVQQWQTDECSDLDWRQVWVFRFVNTSASACYQLFMFVLYFALPTLNERIEGHVHFCRLW